MQAKKEFCVNNKPLYILLFLITSIAMTSCNTGYEIEKDVVLYTYWHEGMGFESQTFEVTEADPVTFKELNHKAFGVDKDHAYYKGILIENSIGKSFESIDNGFSKDSENVYYMYRVVQNADSKTFKLINGGPFSQDSKGIYYYWQPIGAGDPTSFEIIDNLGAKDNSFYYSLSNSGEKLHINKYPIKDKNSFQILDSRYSKDMFQVYFDGEIVDGADSKTFEITDYAKGKDSKYIYYGKSKISSPETFKKLSDGYSIDDISVYFEYDLIKGASPKSFEIINQFWAKDEANVYFQGRKTTFLDENSFQYIEGKYVKDANRVYYLDSILVNADPKTIESVDWWDWVRDENSYFFMGQKLNNIDYSSFRILENDYSKDKNNVYFQLNVLKDVDVQSFQTTDGTYGGSDKHGEFYMGERY